MHDFSAGGTERVALALAGEWAAAGHRVTILSGVAYGDLRSLIPVNVKVEVLTPEIRRGRFSRMRLAGRMYLHLQHRSPDVIFIIGNYHFSLASKLCRLQPRPVIVAKISNPVWRWQHASIIDRLIFARVTRGIDAFAPMSNGLADGIAVLDRRRPVRAIEDPMIVPKIGMSAAGAAGADIVVCIGRLVHQKNFALALKTIAQLSRQRVIRLQIYGDGPDRAKLEALASKLSISDLVVFGGQVDNIALKLADAAVLLITSRYEGGPAVAVEALMAGVPIVTTDCSHLLRELLADPAAGTIVRSSDPRLLASELDRVLNSARPNPKNLAVLKKFVAGVSAKQYLQMFEMLCSRRAAPARSAEP